MNLLLELYFDLTWRKFKDNMESISSYLQEFIYDVEEGHIFFYFKAFEWEGFE